MSRKRKVFILIAILSAFLLFEACGKKQETKEEKRQEETVTGDVVLPEDSLDDADMSNNGNADNSVNKKEEPTNSSNTVDDPQEGNSLKDEKPSTDLPDTEGNEEEEQVSRPGIVFPEINF